MKNAIVNRENDSRRNGLIGTVREEFHAHNASEARATMITNLRVPGYTSTESRTRNAIGKMLRQEKDEFKGTW